jgi:cobyrinic acid a,c-diamide synthase
VTPAFLVAGTHSGVGKTTLAFTLMALLRKEGHAVQPFKIGPDFIDSGYHRLATGRDSINLDLWMMGWPGVEESFRRYSSKADISILEGMGGLFDGKNGTVLGSSADIAKRLNVPVILVMDIWGMTVTTGAILNGIMGFDRQVRLGGILLNRAGSRGHFEMVMKSLKPVLRKKVLGYLLRSPDFEIPERHLGLKTLEENKKAPRILRAAVQSAFKTIDVQKLMRVQKKIGTRFIASKDAIHAASTKTIPQIRIGIAKDPAFCFYYSENLRMLREAGAELIPFSPLKDKRLPRVDGLYLGGGYPESFSRELAANQEMRRAILEKIREGLPVYAECGGLMYLSQSLTGFDGKTYPMVGALPLRVRMDQDRLTIRYIEAKTTQDNLLGPKGTVVRGQEFHQSRIISSLYRGKPVYRAGTSTGEKFAEGFQLFNFLASYFHLHFKSNPSIPRAFVEKCGEQKSHPQGTWARKTKTV